MAERQNNPWATKKLLITGGTGSFGKAFVAHVLKHRPPRALRIYSRDELKQFEMRQTFPQENLRFFIGDVRDKERLDRAMRGVDIVIHAAAMKQVVASEYNPFEAIKTNVLGTQNVIDTAINSSVSRVMSVSTDKAVNPVNLYGATKLCQERIVVQGNAYVGPKKTRLSCVRYGNVVGSRGSVIPLFLKQKASGTLTITDERMTRFWITLKQAVEFVITSIDMAQGGEIFVPKIPSMRVTDVARAIAPSAKFQITGIRPGEKLHECLLTSEESRHARDLGDRYVILPQFDWRKPARPDGEAVPEGFVYSSDQNDDWLSADAIGEMIHSHAQAAPTEMGPGIA